MAIEIVIKNDADGMFGSEPTDNIDVTQTIANYEAEITEAIQKVYPGAVVEHQYGPYGGPSIKIYDGDEDDHDEIAEIIARVYNNGSFWSQK